MRSMALALLALVACQRSDKPAVIAPTGVVIAPRGELIAPAATDPLPAHGFVTLDTSLKARRRAVPAEVVLRAYLGWFGGLAPREAFLRARGNDLFDQWSYYLAALGLPDHHVDAPRVSQSNTVMLATMGRMGEALCIRSIERDLRTRTTPLADRVIFAFEPVVGPDRAAFASRFDVLHRTFLGYPATLAPTTRTERFFALYRAVAARHRGGRLTADETAWAAVCTALVQHPEAWLY
ncbi:MAG: putative rane protein [Myxococcales bacterium]|nr:putative rane protein [Myxococcales bacterium]